MSKFSAEADDAGRWSAASHIRNGLIFTALLVFGLGTWSATARLAGAVISPGQVRVEANHQVVEHPDGGVVGEILVRNGDRVAAGEVLIRLDGTRLRSELAVLESQLYELMARRGRLEAEQAGADAITFDPELVERAAADPRVAALMRGQNELFVARSGTLGREIELIGERQRQLEQQIAGTEAEIASLERQSELISRELADQRGLFEKGLSQATRVLALEREAARLEGNRAQLVAQVAQLRGKISELGIEQLRLEADRREEAVAELRDIGYRELELKEQRFGLREQLSRLDLRAPRAGVVYDMTVHALQSVVRPAEPVLYIAPEDADLVVDARVAPVHIDQLHPSQQAVLRFPALDSRTTPEIFGTVSNISPDALRDEVTDETYYSVEVVLGEGEVEKLGEQHLIPGMPVEVFIQTGVRTPLNYLVRPMTDYFAHAMREE